MLLNRGLLMPTDDRHHRRQLFRPLFLVELGLVESHVDRQDAVVFCLEQCGPAQAV